MLTAQVKSPIWSRRMTPQKESEHPGCQATHCGRCIAPVSPSRSFRSSCLRVRGGLQGHDGGCNHPFASELCGIVEEPRHCNGVLHTQHWQLPRTVGREEGTLLQNLPGGEGTSQEATNVKWVPLLLSGYVTRGHTSDLSIFILRLSLPTQRRADTKHATSHQLLFFSAAPSL